MTRLLFDQNLSPGLVKALSDIYPNSNHTEMVGLGKALDREIWEYSRFQRIRSITRFTAQSNLDPPGNCSTKDIENILRENADSIKQLSEDPHIGILMIF